MARTPDAPAESANDADRTFRKTLDSGHPQGD
jgi:hypothetical protein